MSHRRSFIKNSLMALAVSLLPKTLQPSIPEISEEYEKPIFAQMELLIPDYAKAFIEKYGNDDFTFSWNQIGKTSSLK